MLDAAQDPAQAYLERVAAGRDRRLARRPAGGRRDARAAARHRRPERAGHGALRRRRRAPAVVPGHARRRTTWACASPRMPMGHEFTSLVLALLQAGGHPPKVEADVDRADPRARRRLRLRDLHLADLPQLPRRRAGAEPDGGAEPARAATSRSTAALFQDEVEARQIMAVPSVFLNGEPFGSGRMELAEILAKVDTGAAARDAARLGAKDAFDMLIVGGGPAGAAAAVYAARKGIRTGVVAERFGGQTLDTHGHRELHLGAAHRGPEVRRRAGSACARLRRRHHERPARRGARAGDASRAATITVTLANGAALKSRSVVLATGARWRNVDVPGEARVPQQGRGLLPALRRPAVQGQARRGDRRRQLRRRGGDRPGRRRRARHADRVRRRSSRPTRCWSTSCSSLPNVDDPHQRADAPRSPATAPRSTACVYKDRASGDAQRGRARRRVRADRPGAQHRVAQGHGRAVSRTARSSSTPRAPPACRACSPPAT